MNLERLQQAIAIMERAGRVDMTDWQSGKIVKTESEIHPCGNSACFAGWVAVSPEFQEVGGFPNYDGSPALPNLKSMSSGDVIAEWLETDNIPVVELLVYGEMWGKEVCTKFLENHGIAHHRTSDDHCVVLENWEDYTAKDVIKYLNALKGLSYSK